MRQWDDPSTRAERLLNADAWPVRLPIAKPRAKDIETDLDGVRAALAQWRGMKAGTVHWQPVRFRALADSIEVPVAWEIARPSEWVQATASERVAREFRVLSTIIGGIDPAFHELLVRRRSLIEGLEADEVITAARLALALEPGCAERAPLRALPFDGIDTKFFERNRTLVTKLLDVRFDGAVSDVGLEAFLDASRDASQWLLVADLDGSLLPFAQLRIRDAELAERPLPGKQVLIVENERCLHHLPELADTVAVLGAGLNLHWMAAPWLADRRVAYWGDIDSWGFVMLARARQHCPGLVALLMDASVFDEFGDRAVAEPVPADLVPAMNLSSEEARLCERLLAIDRGRLEQEYLPTGIARRAITRWAELALPSP